MTDKTKPLRSTLRLSLASATARNLVLHAPAGQGVKPHKRTAAVQGLQLRRQQLTGVTAQNLRQMNFRQGRLQREITELRMAMKAIQERHEQLEKCLIAPDMLAPHTHKSVSDDEGTAPAVAHAWTELLHHGEAVRIGWVRSGLLVPSSTLAEAWGRTRQALEQASRRGELFSIKVGKNRYYPAVFAKLEANAVKSVCLALKGDDTVAKFAFCTRAHGGLGGQTLFEALTSGLSDRVIDLAVGWSAEHGHAKPFADETRLGRAPAE